MKILSGWFLCLVFHFPEPSPLGGAGSVAPPGRELPAAYNILRDERLKAEISADLGRHILARLHRSPHATQTPCWCYWFVFLIIDNNSRENPKVSTDCICWNGRNSSPAVSCIGLCCRRCSPDWLLDLTVVGPFTTTKPCCGERAFSDLRIYRFFSVASVPKSEGQYQ